MSLDIVALPFTEKQVPFIFSIGKILTFERKTNDSLKAQVDSKCSFNVMIPVYHEEPACYPDQYSQYLFLVPFL